MPEAVAVQKLVRSYISADLEIENWDSIRPICDELTARPITSAKELEQWLMDRSEFESVVGEDYRWRYIQKTRHTENEQYDSSYNFFVEHIQPHLMRYSNEMNKKFHDSPFLEELDAERYFIYKRSVKNNIALYRKENIPLMTELETRSKKYYVITGGMTVEIDGKELTMQQAGKLLEDKNRSMRELAWTKMADRRLQDTTIMDDLFDELLQLRHRIAVNAGYDNYRDYKLQSLGRFDYWVEECEQFHDAVESEIIPLVNKLKDYRRRQLGLDQLRPWDGAVDLGEQEPAVPFSNVEELVSRSVECLEKVDPYFGGCLKTMHEMGHLDLDSRKGKAPGGYNCGLPETGVPFIFMNAAGTGGDVKTMLHEGGHAVHSFLMNDLDYQFDREINSEEAELASMSMELFALDAYDSFYEDPADRRQAIFSSLESMLEIIPWIALIDKFQHWLYTHPEHSREERRSTWTALYKRFSTDRVDWTGHEDVMANLWHRQLHVFLIPFYYIEYGIARLGSIAMWRNYIRDPETTIANYKHALSLGNTKSLPEMYAAAGVPFDFSRSYIRELKEFVMSRLDQGDL
jgi:oligoendopeptidase F